jgi:hypothetical protein
MRKIIFLLVFVLAMSSFALAAENTTAYDKSLVCLADSMTSMKTLMDSGFNVQRVNDTLRQADSMFDAQSALREGGREGNFSLVLEYCDEIAQMEKSAFQARDELLVLKRFYNESLTSDMNTSLIDETIIEIEGEIQSERYEKVSPLIEQGYGEIINIKSENTALNLIYQSTAKTLKKVLLDNWKYILVGFGVLLFLFIFFKNTLSQWWIRKNISSLESRKETIKDLIRKTQRSYFEGGDISEMTYTIRIKKFGELIRDIDRQIPLLQEQLMKVLRKENKSVPLEVKRKK